MAPILKNLGTIFKEGGHTRIDYKINVNNIDCSSDSCYTVRCHFYKMYKPHDITTQHYRGESTFESKDWDEILDFISKLE